MGWAWSWSYSSGIVLDLAGIERIDLPVETEIVIPTPAMVGTGW